MGLSVLRRIDLRMGDVDIQRRDGGADIGKSPLLVMADNSHLDRVFPFFADIPMNIHQPFGIHILDMRAIGRMNRDPPSTRDVTDNLVTGDRIAALSEPDHDIIDPGQRHADRLSLRTFFSRSIRWFSFSDLLLREEMMNDVLGRHPSVTDEGHQIVEGIDVIFL